METAVLIPLILAAIKEAPELIEDFREIFTKANPTDADWEALRQKVLAKSYRDYVPATAIDIEATVEATPPIALLAAPTMETVSHALTGLNLGPIAPKTTPYVSSVTFPNALGQSPEIQMIKGLPAGVRLVQDAPGQSHLIFDSVVNESIAQTKVPCKFTVLEAGGPAQNFDEVGAPVGEFMWGARKRIVCCSCYTTA